MGMNTTLDYYLQYLNMHIGTTINTLLHSEITSVFSCHVCSYIATPHPTIFSHFSALFRKLVGICRNWLELVGRNRLELVVGIGRTCVECRSDLGSDHVRIMFGFDQTLVFCIPRRVD